MNRLLPALCVALFVFSFATCTSPTEPDGRTPTPKVTPTPTPTQTPVPTATLTGKVTVEGWNFATDGSLTNQVQVQVQGSGLTWWGTTDSNGVYGPIYNIVPGPVVIQAWMTTRGGWSPYATSKTLTVGVTNFDIVIMLIR